MDNVVTLKQEAADSRKQGEFVNAVELYRVLWEEHREECNEWDGWGYAFCLRKIGRSEEALVVCREAMKLNPDLEHLISLCGWCLYDTEMKRPDSEIQTNEARFLDAADEILRSGTLGQYTAHARTLMRVIDYYRKKPASPAARILEWCDRIAPEQLSTMPGQGHDDKGRMIDYASDREKWYACRSKALLELEQYEECIAVSEEALLAFPTFHHDNDIWFQWRIALSRASLGDKESAIRELEELLARKRDWFIHHKIAQFLFELGRTDEALARAIDAALGPGQRELEYRWELFLLMGWIHHARGERELAQKHVLLSARLRQEKDWKMPPALIVAISELGVDMGIPTPSRDLERELRRGWMTAKLSDMPQGQGEIKTILPEGNAGFIRGDDGRDFYFKASWFEGSRNLMEQGTRVSFVIEKSSDPKKRDMARYIKPHKTGE